MNINLHYQEQGTGMPLILLHGNGEDSTYFARQIKYFSKSYRVIAIDTRGHGKSPRGTAPFSINQFAEDLNVFMERMDLQQAIILGFSDGANIAMRFALKYPEKVTALILNGGNLNGRGVKFSVQFPIVLEYYVAKLFTKMSLKAKRKMELYGLMVNDPNIYPAEIRQIHCATLVIAGKKDMIKDSHTRLIAKCIPGARLSIIEGTHFIAKEEHVAFNHVVEKFLKKI